LRTAGFSVRCVRDAPPEEVTIGTQTWMKKNLDVAYYLDGTIIPQITDPTSWANATEGAWCYYNNDPANGAIYGKLYNWYAVNSPHGLAPKGWHVPSYTEWSSMFDFLGGINVAGGKMKETGFTHWQSPNTGATNESGFNALPAGDRLPWGEFFILYGCTHWWTSDNPDIIKARSVDICTWRPEIGSQIWEKTDGFSVRCVKDAPPDLNTGLVAYYPFNTETTDGNGNRTTPDESGNGNTGTVYGATQVADRYGNAKKAYGFDGSNSISIPNLYTNTNTELTVSAFIVSDKSQNGKVFYNGQSGEVTVTNKHIGVKLSDGNWYGSGYITDDNLITGKHYISATWLKGRSLKFYIDGNLLTNNTNIPNLFLKDPGACFTTKIGAYGDCNSHDDFFGIIDDIRIYNRALTDAEVKALYEMEKGGEPDVTFTLQDIEGNPLSNEDIEVFQITETNIDTKNIGIKLCKVENNNLCSIKTDSEGKLTLKDINDFYYPQEPIFKVGNKIKFQCKIGEINAVKPNNEDNKQRIMFKITLDNGKIKNDDGDFEFNSIKEGNQNVYMNHATLRYNLVTSIEWNANTEYIGWLMNQYRLMSNYLFDVFDGQLCLDSVWIYNNREQWDEADINIYAMNYFDNAMNTNAKGIFFEHKFDKERKNHIQTPRNAWWRDVFKNIETSSNPNWISNDIRQFFYRILTHEFGHYAFGFWEEYKTDDKKDGHDIFPSNGSLKNYFLSDLENYELSKVFNFGIMDRAMDEYDDYLSTTYHYTSEMSNFSRYDSRMKKLTEQWTNASLTAHSFNNTLAYNQKNSDCWSLFKWINEEIFNHIPNIKYRYSIKSPEDITDFTLSSSFLKGPNNETIPNCDVSKNDRIIFPSTYSTSDFGDYPMHCYYWHWSWKDLKNIKTDAKNADVSIIRVNESDKELYQGKTASNGQIIIIGSESGDKIRIFGKLFLENGDVKYFNGLKNLEIVPKKANGKVVDGTLGEENNEIELFSISDSLFINFDITCLSNGNKKIVCKSNKGLPELPFLEINNNGSLDTLHFTSPSPNNYEVEVAAGYLSNIDLNATFYAQDLHNNQFFVPLSIKNLSFSKQTGTIFRDGLQLSLDTNNVFSDVLIQSNNFKPLTDGIDTLNFNLGKIYNIHSCSTETLTGSNWMTISFGMANLPDSLKPLVRIYWWDNLQNKWVYYGGVPDTASGTISAEFTKFGSFALFTIYGFPLPQGVPNKLSPANTSYTNIHGKFVWNKLINATRYELIVSDVSDFSNIVIHQSNIADTSFNFSLTTNKTYYWTIKAYGLYGETGWSDVWSFTTESLALNNPKAGDIFSSSTSINIQYTSAGVGNVSIDYTTNNGSTWNNIVQNEAATGTHLWTADVPVGCSYKLKIYDSQNPEVAATSGTFSVTSVKLLTPTAGSKLVFNQKYGINWSSCGVAQVKLEYSTDGGENWIVIVFMTDATAGTYLWSVPKVASDNYQIRISDALNSEMNALSDVFSVSKYPDFTINLVDKIVCKGKGINLGNVDSLGVDNTIKGGSGKFKINWNPARLYNPTTTNPTLTMVTTNMSFTISVTDVESGQKGSATMKVIADVPPSVKIKITSMKSKTGENIYLKDFLSIQNGIQPYSFFWTNKSGWSSNEINPFISSQKAGTFKYYVTVTDSNGCASAECAFSVKINPSNGRIIVIGDDEAIAGEGEISVFPNPTTGMLNIYASFGQKDNIEIKLLNALGQEVYSVSLQEASVISEQLDMSTLSAGLYMLKVTKGGTNFFSKVIKE